MLAIVVAASLVILVAGLSLIRMVRIPHSPNADLLIQIHEACLQNDSPTKKL